MSGFGLENRTYLVSGVSNKKSVAAAVVNELLENNAKVILTVESDEHLERVKKLYPTLEAHILNVRNEDSIKALAKNFKDKEIKLNGFLHSMAFANYSEGIKPFHETKWEDFAEAIQISCFSFVSMSNHLTPVLADGASLVTVSISNLKATTYGYMGPIKAMLESSVHFLAKSISKVGNIRVNAVGAGPLKTSASAGIPGYINNYIFSEAMTLRKKALETREVAESIVYLLSPKSSGINGTTLLVDAGMQVNGFDEELVEKFSR